MAHPKKSERLTGERKKEHQASGYYDDSRLYVRTSAGRAARTLAPISGEGELIPRYRDTSAVPPNGTVTWYSSGPEGVSIQTTETFVDGGGHMHSNGSTDPRAAGTVTPSTITISGPYPQNIVQTYQAGAFCGHVHEQNTASNGQPIDSAENDYIICVSGLVCLAASTGVVLVGSNPQHPSNHWGVPTLCAKLAELGAAFQAQFNEPIYVNDMSLQTGGLFDIKANLAPPHTTHQDGREADVNWSHMSVQERAWFQSKALSLGFRVELHQNPTHWHLII